MADDQKTNQQTNQPMTIPFSDLVDEDAQDSEDELILDQLANSGNGTINQSSPPSVLGEQSVSGDMPDPDSDDDTLANMKQVGLQTDADYDEPRELNSAKDVEEGEKLHRDS